MNVLSERIDMNSKERYEIECYYVEEDCRFRIIGSRDRCGNPEDRVIGKYVISGHQLENVEIFIMDKGGYEGVRTIYLPQTSFKEIVAKLMQSLEGNEENRVAIEKLIRGANILRKKWG
jgi:hypothetical protein